MARAIIVSANPNETDVPSPTFSLVQTYELADRTSYGILIFTVLKPLRMQCSLDLMMLLLMQFALIEWPDRLKNSCQRALSIHLCLDGDDDVDGIRFADITAPLNWAERMRALL